MLASMDNPCKGGPASARCECITRGDETEYGPVSVWFGPRACRFGLCDTCMSKHFLDMAQVGSSRQQMSCKAVPHGVRTDPGRDPCDRCILFHKFPDCFPSELPTGSRNKQPGDKGPDCFHHRRSLPVKKSSIAFMAFWPTGTMRVCFLCRYICKSPVPDEDLPNAGLRFQRHDTRWRKGFPVKPGLASKNSPGTRRAQEQPDLLWRKDLGNTLPEFLTSSNSARLSRRTPSSCRYLKYIFNVTRCLAIDAAARS